MKWLFLLGPILAGAASLAYAFSDEVYRWALDALHQSQTALSSLSR